MFSSGTASRSHICRKAAFSGSFRGEALRQARALINSDSPNFTVLLTGMSKVWVRAESLSTVRSCTMLRSSIGPLAPSLKKASAAARASASAGSRGMAALSSDVVGTVAAPGGGVVGGALSRERNSSALRCCTLLFCAVAVTGVPKASKRLAAAQVSKKGARNISGKTFEESSGYINTRGRRGGCGRADRTGVGGGGAILTAVFGQAEHNLTQQLFEAEG